MEREVPWQSRRVVYSIPGSSEPVVTRNLVYRSIEDIDLKLDVYRPPAASPVEMLPGVIFIHGGPVSPGESLKDAGQYRSWGALAAASGLVGVTFNHRYHAPEMLVDSAVDVRAAIASVRERAEEFWLDSDRICLWTCSGGGPLIAFALRHRPSYVRCLVFYYAIMDPGAIPELASSLNQDALHQLSPLAAIGTGPPSFPIFVARAGQDDLLLNQTVDAFVGRCLQVNASIELMNHPQGRHAFPILDDDACSRQIIARTLSFIGENTK